MTERVRQVHNPGYFFMPLLPMKEVSTHYITKVVCELHGRAA